MKKVLLAMLLVFLPATGMMPQIASAAEYTYGRVYDYVDHAFVIKIDGTLWGWGSNRRGELGDGTTTDRDVPVKIMDGVKQLSGGDIFHVALKFDGTLWGWSGNSAMAAPVKIMDGVASIPERPALNVSMRNNTFAFKTDGSLWDFGDLSAPRKVLDNVAYAYRAIVGGHSVALKIDGTVWAWGDNETGYIGDGTSTYRESPVQVMSGVKSIHGDGMTTHALKNDGSLWAWGNNNIDGSNLGDGTAEDRYAPVHIMDDVASVIKNEYLNWNTFVIKTDHSLWGWGHDIRENEITTSPVHILDDVKSIANTETRYVIKTDDSLWTWDYSTGYITKVMDNVAIVSADNDRGDAEYTSALTNDGTLWVWGQGDIPIEEATEEDYLYEGDEVTMQAGWGGQPVGKPWGVVRAYRPQPTKILENVVHWPQNVVSDFAITEDGSLYAWGRWHGVTENSQYMSQSPRFYRATKITDNMASPIPAEIQESDSFILVATPTASTVLINGKEIAFDAYNINGSNYFKLRDLAVTLSGTEKQFEVDWDGDKNTIILISGKPYTVAGGEMTGKRAVTTTPTPTNSTVYLDGEKVQFTAYNIEGNNYFKLRDIGEIFDFEIDWDGTKSAIVIDTNKRYTPD